MPSKYYHEMESKLIFAEQNRCSLSRVMESVDRNRLSSSEYDELHSVYETLWEASDSGKKKKELYSDFDYADLCRGGDLSED